MDAAEINKNVPADYRVLGDLRWSLPLFQQKLKATACDYKARYSMWHLYVTEMNNEKPFSYKKNTGCIMPEAVVEQVSALMDDDTIVVTDVGQHQMWAAQFYDCKKPRQFLTSGGLGTMGYGLPAAIGAKLGAPDKKVVLFSGDGSIMMNCQEFATAADNDIDIKIIVLHNHVLGMVAQWQRMFYDNHYSQSVLQGKTDLVKLAEAMGATGYRVDEPSALATVLKKALAQSGPVLVDVMVPAAEDVLPMVPGGKRLDQMVLGGDNE